MLLLNPRRVTFAASVWEDVALVAIDRAAARLALDWGDLGPHPVFADVPEQRVTIRVVQHVARGDPDGPRPGDEGQLVLHTSPAASDAGRRRLTARAVVTEVTHELSLRRATTRTITLVAVSETGADDPIAVTPAEVSPPAGEDDAA